MIGILRKVFKFLTRPRIKYEPLVKVLISREALLHNYRVYRKAFSQVAAAPVLKSNAYGHGLVEVASILDAERPPFFVVDSFFEALILRRAGVKSKILVIGYTRPEIMLRKNLKDTAFVVTALETLALLSSRLRRPQTFHLKIDTGMHRQGLSPQELPEAAKLAAGNPNIVLEGVCTHFADADNPDGTFTKQQLKLWNSAAAQGRELFPSLVYLHALATKGMHLTSQATGNVARLGIGIYGILPTPHYALDLRPVLEMRSIVGMLKDVPGGAKIGYSGVFESKTPMKIAIIPAGYNEGVDLRLTNKGFVSMRGRPCPIVGRISMNITTVDVTGVSEPRVGEEVVLISGARESPNSVESIAKICHTIPHEILVHIPVYLRRIII